MKPKNILFGLSSFVVVMFFVIGSQLPAFIALNMLCAIPFALVMFGYNVGHWNASNEIRVQVRSRRKVSRNKPTYTEEMLG